MKRSFSTRDAKKLMNSHSSLLRSLNYVFENSEQYKRNIQNACTLLKSHEAKNALREIPIEELNREKRRINIKPLKDHLYQSIADIHAASMNQLVSIKGISQDSAQKAKKFASTLAHEIQQEIKVKISADDRNPASTDLIRSIAIYRRSKQNLDICRSLLFANNDVVINAIHDLRPAKSSLRWFFSSKESKEAALLAYDKLSELLNELYFDKAKQALLELDEATKIQGDDAWDDFQENSVDFFIVLEEIDPSFVDANDSLYGLPEQLAHEIQNEELFLNGLRCSLRRYQEWGVKYILHQKRVLLGDEMGLGKTIQAIASMVSLKNIGATHFLVVCPASVITNWCREITKHSSLEAIKIHGLNRLDMIEHWKKNGGVAVTTYETTCHFAMDDDFHFSLLVADEAHYLKNPKAKRTINTKKLCKQAERLLFMTGTALENVVEEMVSLIDFLQPEIARQLLHILYQSTAPQFREKIAPVYYRRKREDVLSELPELIENQEWCPLLAEEETIYEQAILDQKFHDARQVSWNIDDLTKSSKAKRLLEIIEQAEAEGRKVIVFSFFLETIKKIHLFLGNRCMSPINGSVAPQRRQEIIDEFDKAPAGSVLIAQIQSGGTGLNIQSASVVVICEPQFKPSIENQAISRSYRMGQTRNVLVYRLLAENTVDERITSILDEKTKIFNAFADKSAVAEESLELDERMFGGIIQGELKRIQSKRGLDPEKLKIQACNAGTPSKEYQLQMTLSYTELTQFLLQKYGGASGDYFLNNSCSSKNKKISRTSEGLYCHHIDEDKAPKLSDSTIAKKYPFAYQKADRLVYCNILEHLLLHIKIAEESKESLGITGAILYICPEINDFYNGEVPVLPWKINIFNAIEDSFSDYISILQYFWSVIEKDRVYFSLISKESIAQGSQGNLIEKIYNQL